MIPFEDITLDNKEEIDRCLIGNPYRACDFSFTNLYTWQPRFKTKFAVVQDTLFLRSQDVDGSFYYMMPNGKMSLTDAIALIREDAKVNNIPFVMKAISERMWHLIEAALPGQFRYRHDRDNDEYIYLSERLIKLSGKKLQSKRNHINRFKADNPDWQYFRLNTDAERAECLAMLDDWEELSRPKDDQTLKYDYIATKQMLEHFDYLQLRGGGIRVNNKLVAFTIGEALTEDSFVVHVEKAFAEMNGAYTIINQQFILNEASEFTYINREEDMGLENLRKAKMSYIPDILLEEYIVEPIDN